MRGRNLGRLAADRWCVKAERDASTQLKQLLLFLSIGADSSGQDRQDVVGLERVVVAAGDRAHDARGSAAARPVVLEHVPVVDHARGFATGVALPRRVVEPEAATDERASEVCRDGPEPAVARDVELVIGVDDLGEVRRPQLQHRLVQLEHGLVGSLLLLPGPLRTHRRRHPLTIGISRRSTTSRHDSCASRHDSRALVGIARAGRAAGAARHSSASVNWPARRHKRSDARECCGAARRPARASARPIRRALAWAAARRAPAATATAATATVSDRNQSARDTWLRVKM